jgi:hypothetical protein
MSWRFQECSHRALLLLLLFLLLLLLSLCVLHFLSDVLPFSCLLLLFRLLLRQLRLSFGSLLGNYAAALTGGRSTSMICIARNRPYSCLGREVLFLSLLLQDQSIGRLAASFFLRRLNRSLEIILPFLFWIVATTIPIYRSRTL